MDHVLKFTDQEMGVLNMALGEIPHKFAAPLIQSINKQIAAAQGSSAGQPADASENETIAPCETQNGEQ